MVKNNKLFKSIIILVIVALSISVIRYGLYIDENGLLVLYREMYRGSHMFTDSWESYNLAGVLLSPIFALYYQVLEPIIYPLGIGLVLYMRIVYLILRAIIAIYFYSVLKKSQFEKGAFAASIFFYIYVVAWKNISYKSLCDFAVILFICFLIRYFDTKKQGFFIGMALATCLAILAYPTMIVFPFVFCISLIVMHVKGYELLKSMGLYAITCFVAGAIYLVYLQLTSGIMESLNQLQYIEDSAYDHSLIVRIGLMFGGYAVVAAISCLMLLVVLIIKKMFNITEETGDSILAVIWLAFLTGICLIRINGIGVSRFTYALLIVFFWAIFFNFREEKKDYTLVGAYKLSDIGFEHQLISICVISGTVQLIWALSTNQNLSVPALMSYYGAIVMILWICEKRESMKLLVLFLIIAAGFFNFVCVSEKNGGFYSVFEDRYYVTDGALKGIALLQDDYEKNQICYELMNEYVDVDSRLLVTFGTNSTAYLNSDAKLGVGSPYTRVHINKRLLEYWECNPQNKADYVLIDENCDKYETFLDSECGKYILENYTNVVAERDGFVLLSQ